MQLEHSMVQRGGVTANYWYGETSFISTSVVSGNLRFEFQLPSKGGGDTLIHLTVDAKDLRAIIRDLAENQPAFADAFTKAAHIAVVRLQKDRAA